MKLWEKVNNITGNASKARFLVEHLNAGAKFIVSSLPEKFLWTVASEVEVNGFDSTGANIVGNGSDLAYDKILAVYRNDGTKKRICQEIPKRAVHITDEPSSLSFPTKMFPKYYKLSGKIYIKPDPDYNDYAGLEDSTCDTTDGSPNVTMNSTANIEVGMKITGPGLTGTTVQSITNSTTFVASSNASANGTDVTLKFGKVYTPIGGSLTALNYKEGDKGVIVYSAPPIIDENTDSWVLTEYENVAILYAASLDMLRLSSTIDVEKILEGGMASVDTTSKTSLSAIHWLEDEDPEMAMAVVQVADGDSRLANARLQRAIGFYERAISELQAITGALTAPPKQQQSQRQQEGATS